MKKTFNRAQRLTNPSEFQRVYRSGYHGNSQYFRYKLLPHRELDLAPNERPTSARLGITVSKKISKKAVQRNRIKRQVREAFRQQKTIKVLPIDLVITAKNGSAEASKDNQQKSLQELWIKIDKWQSWYKHQIEKPR